MATIAPSKAPLQASDLGSILTLSGDAASVNSAQHENVVGRGLVLGINITAISGTTPTITVKLFGVDQASGQSYLILASTAISVTGFTTLTVFPGATAAANSVANFTLPAKWFVTATIGGTGPSVTGTIGASVLS